MTAAAATQAPTMARYPAEYGGGHTFALADRHGTVRRFLVRRDLIDGKSWETRVRDLEGKYRWEPVIDGLGTRAQAVRAAYRFLDYAICFWCDGIDEDHSPLCHLRAATA